MRKKLFVIFLIIIILLNLISPILNAIDIDKANLIYDHAIDTHIMFFNANNWHTIKGGYICYEEKNEKYPAYCISHGIHGVDEEGNYTVTINNLLNDKLIYNTILNGYPYKTPQQLGVNNVDEAYIATKQAIYSVILERNVKEFYKAKDDAGEKIIEAIYNIAENGKNGNIDNKEPEISIQKIDELKEEGNYFYQEYSVTANVNINEYSIDSIEGFSEGALISDIKGNKTEIFKTNENFRIMIPKEDFKSDIEGKINITSSCKTNSIFYGEAPKNTVQDYAITYKPYSNYSASIKLNIDTDNAKIVILKEDSETNKPIEDVTFEIYNNKYELLDTKTTNEEGKIVIENLYQGKYYAKEIKANENYVIDSQLYEIEAKYNEVTKEVIKNIHKKGNLKILKVDKDNNDITLGGIEFDLINENGETIKHAATDANGEIYIENIDIGNYKIKETLTKDEYKLCTDENIEVKWNETTNITIENEKKKGKIEIYKVDSQNHEIKIKNTEFELINKNGDIVEKLKTDENGYAISSNHEIGKYYLKEIKTDDNYINNTNIYEIEIKYNEKTQKQIENEHKKGNLKILKVDKDDNNITLGGIEFDLINENGEIIKHAATNANGEIYIEDINTGMYTIRETKTKNEYKLSSDQKVEIKYNETTSITIENEKKKGKIEIYKVDSKNHEIKIKNAEFELINKNGNVVEKLKTDENGYAISSNHEIGKYYLKEIKTDDKYILNSQELLINIKEGQISKLIIENDKIKGKIKIIKSVSSDSELLNLKKGDKLSDVQFQIYDYKNKLIETIITDENGEALSSDLEIGKYIIKEVNRKKGFLENVNSYCIEIKENNKIETINIENTPIIARINIKKSGVEYAEKNEEIKYEFDVKNNSNTNLDSLILIDHLPYEKTDICKIITGTYNEEMEYKIYYKTNINDYKLLKNVNSFVNEYIDLNIIELNNNEKITEIKIEYGNVSENFSNEIKPNILMKVGNNVKKDEEIINTANLTGVIDNYTIKDESSFITKIKEKEIVKKLPKTGG